MYTCMLDVSLAQVNNSADDYKDLDIFELDSISPEIQINIKVRSELGNQIYR